MPFAGLKIEFFNHLQGIIPLFSRRGRHPGKAAGKALLFGVHHRELTTALTETGGFDRLRIEIDAALVEQALGDEVEVHISEILIRTDRWKIAVINALHDHLSVLFPGIEVMKHKAIRSINDPWFLTRKSTAVSGDQPKFGFAIGIGREALSRSLLSKDEGERIEIDRILQKHRPIGRDGEVMQEGKSGKRISAITEQITGTNSSRGIVGGRKFHQANGAARPGFHSEGHHPRVTVMARVETRVSTKGLPFLEHTTEKGNASCLQGLRI